MNKIREIADNMVFTETEAVKTNWGTIAYFREIYHYEDFMVTTQYSGGLGDNVTLYNLTITTKIVPLNFLERRTLLKGCKRIQNNIRKQKRAVLYNIKEE